MPDKKTVFSTPWFFIEEELFHGKLWYRVVESNAVCVLAMTVDKKIILVRQFRPVINEYTLELPAGHIEDCEDVITCARRELYEETGYTCDKWILMASDMFVHSGRSTMRMFLFYGLDAVFDSLFVPKENIEVRLATLSEFKRLIINGECKQNVAVSALQLASWRRLISADF